MLTLNPLRFTVITLGLFAAMASAQAAPGGLAITFEEDVASGHLTITFSGETITPFATSQSFTFGFVSVSDGSILVSEGDDDNPYYATPTGFGWSVQNMLWLADYGAPLVSNSGTGGFMYNETFGSIQIEILSGTHAAAGEPITWDGEVSYLASLADFGLIDGQSGTIIFSRSGESIAVIWSATVIPVPEPATYALALGLGAVGVALYRRRMSRR